MDLIVLAVSGSQHKPMNEHSQRVGPMANPPHLGELIRESMGDVGWSVVTETALRLGCERGTLSRLLNAFRSSATATAFSFQSASVATPKGAPRGGAL